MSKNEICLIYFLFLISVTISFWSGRQFQKRLDRRQRLLDEIRNKTELALHIFTAGERYRARNLMESVRQKLKRKRWLKKDLMIEGNLKIFDSLNREHPASLVEEMVEKIFIKNKE